MGRFFARCSTNDGRSSASALSSASTFSSLQTRLLYYMLYRARSWSAMLPTSPARDSHPRSLSSCCETSPAI